jgi:hypothetical protein
VPDTYYRDRLVKLTERIMSGERAADARTENLREYFSRGAAEQAAQDAEDVACGDDKRPRVFPKRRLFPWRATHFR